MSMNLGMAGADANLASLTGAVKGFEAWGVNARLFFGEQEEGRKYAGALRTLYSGGATDREAFEAILSGRTNVLEDSEGEYRGRTSYDEATGTKTILLGKDALTDGSRFGLNILFAHEAYRDGTDNGALGQLAETDRAVLGHIGAAAGLAGTYGLGSIGGAMTGEVIAAMIAGSTGNTNLLNQVLAGYDSSGDYWKLTEDGDVVFDGEKDLYDENGKLLRKYEGASNSWAEILGDHLDISKSAANQMMVNSDWYYQKGDHSFKIGEGGSETLSTNAAFKARYFVQRDYIDKLWSDFSGDCNVMLESLRSNLLRDALSGKSSSIAGAMLDAMPALEKFMGDYNASLNGGVPKVPYAAAPGMWDRLAAARYHTEDHASLLNRMASDFEAGIRDDSHSMYSLINSSIFPVVGDGRTISITTKSHYPEEGAFLVQNGLAGVSHGQRFGGLGVDLFALNNNYPVATTQYEYVLAQPSSYSWPLGALGGLQLTSYSDLFQQRYLHLQNHSIAQRQLTGLIASAAGANLFRFTLPPGYQIGNVGNTGLSSNPHLHFEFNPYRR